MIRYTHICFFICKVKKENTEKQHLYSTHSFFIFPFYDRKWEKDNEVSLSFFLIHKQKRGNETRYVIYIFYVFAFPFGVFVIWNFDRRKTFVWYPYFISSFNTYKDNN